MFKLIDIDKFHRTGGMVFNLVELVIDNIPWRQKQAVYFGKAISIHKSYKS
jgi:hypothetical protein